jgi:hypothetical protein
MMAEFQEEILGVLKEVDAGIREEVIRKLKERREIRGLLRNAKM